MDAKEEIKKEMVAITTKMKVDYACSQLRRYRPASRAKGLNPNLDSRVLPIAIPVEVCSDTEDESQQV